MNDTRQLSDFTDMTEENFQECIQRLDTKAFMENPTQALTDAGVTLKKGITFKFVETDEEANALPKNVFPLKAGNELSMESLDKVAGGFGPIIVPLLFTNL
jgi:hypothetical protein